MCDYGWGLDWILDLLTAYKYITHVQACAEAINHVDVRVNRRWITQTIKAEVSHEGALVVGS
jgi:hypothetical protein